MSRPPTIQFDKVYPRQMTDDLLLIKKGSRVGCGIGPLTHDKFAAFIRSEHTKWAKLVKDIGIEPK